MNKNIDAKVAKGFGDEWSTFRQRDSDLSAAERLDIFNDYFGIFPWHALPDDSVGLDAGCGSGRWSTEVAPRVGHLHALDASEDALAVAKENLAGAANVTFHLASVGDIPLPPRSLDFAFSLGVLHHVPDTQGAIVSIAEKLKPGAPFLIYLYYSLDNRPAWFRALWRLSDFIRVVTARLPHTLRLAVSQCIAGAVYWPFARLARLTGSRGLPLAYYHDKSFYVMRTDAYDRFCTRLEQRFTRAEIAGMLTRAGFRDIKFSEAEPYWCAVGIKN